ncbi:MAG TPA: DUF1059 domain-containing protein [Acidimicrobiales bacterium]|jgi:predicted small metal-binding protein|nr:DUF1059 domain-containing protein [Acidimicrobiales bacterium]
MSYTMACADVVPGCDAVFEADSKEELLAMVGAHANAVHGGEAGDGQGDGDGGPGCDVVDQSIREH